MCLADRELLGARARALHLEVQLRPYEPAAPPRPHVPGTLLVAHQSLAVPCVPGRLDARNAAYVLRLIDLAIDGALTGEFAAMVTAPVQKSLINEAGIVFSGHTEYLAARAGGGPPVMMLTTGTLRVALATTHLPLTRVSAALSIESLVHTGSTLAHALRRFFGIPAPRIAVCGLNPHAGEGGHLGDEEMRIIGPAIARLRAAGIDATRAGAGRHGVRAAHPRRLRRRARHVPRPGAAGGQARRLRAGGQRHPRAAALRTSVDHGTALDLAGTGRADAGSLYAALELASRLARGAMSGRRGARRAARKRFGQHFLHDPQRARAHRRRARPASRASAWSRSARGAAPSPTACSGCAGISPRCDRDRPRSGGGAAPRRSRSRRRVALHVSDALRFDFTALARERGGRLRIVGNLPYNISTPLLFHLLAQAAALADLHFMLQREVIDRHVRRSRERRLRPPHGHARPVPRHRAAVRRRSRRVPAAAAGVVGGGAPQVRAAPRFAVSPHFAAVVAAAFTKRRKTLRNALAGLVDRSTIAACGLDPGTARPETLAPEAFNDLARALDAHAGAG